MRESASPRVDDLAQSTAKESAHDEAEAEHDGGPRRKILRS